MKFINIMFNTVGLLVCVLVIWVLGMELGSHSGHSWPFCLFIYTVILPAFLIVGVIKLVVNRRYLNILNGSSFFIVALILWIAIHFDFESDVSIWISIILTVLGMGLLVFELLYWFEKDEKSTKT